jgi:alcohol dehydrogenase, propanol-preferring
VAANDRPAPPSVHDASPYGARDGRAAYDRGVRAMVFDGPGNPLRLTEMERPQPGPGQLLIEVKACGVCRTDLHLLDGELPVSATPRVLGHQIVGVAPDGRRVGVPWLGWTCGQCEMCRSGRENLCPHARFTGRDVDGGMAEYALADERYCFPIPEGFPDAQAAPLLCAGLIGHRALRMCGKDAQRVGLYGFGASAHIVAQVAAWQGREVYAFTRSAHDAAQGLALEMGARWAGASCERPPQPLHAAIVFAPVGELVPAALAACAPGGTVVCAGIHMSDIPSFPYELLWQERVLRSVANLTRSDAQEFLSLVPKVPVRTRVNLYDLSEAGRALEDLRRGSFVGAAVLVP